MTRRLQYVRYTLYILLYIFMCIIIFGVRINYFTTKYRLTASPSNVSDKKCNAMRSASTSEQAKHEEPKISNFVTKELENHDLRSDSTDLQDVAVSLQRISETCAKYNLSAPLVKRHFFYSRDSKALYCWIRKAASTSFTKLFSDMWNRSVSHDFYKETDVLAPKTMEQLRALINGPKIFKFLVVRHPFERLVSSYRDRLEDNSRYTAQAWIYARRIFHLTRPKLFYINKTTGSASKKIFYADKRLKLIPTFNEFITWLLQEPSAKDDVHWDAYHSHCSTCDIKYNYVLKLNNHSPKQIGYILSNLSADKSHVYLDLLEETRGGFTDYYRTCNYFKNLTQNSVFKLYRRYKIDFETFNYEFENYMECAKVEF